MGKSGAPANELANRVLQAANEWRLWDSGTEPEQWDAARDRYARAAARLHELPSHKLAYLVERILGQVGRDHPEFTID